METIKHRFAVDLVQEVLDKIPSTRSGTYNRRLDPTHWEKGELEIAGYSLSKWDCTWGIELRVSKISSQEDRVLGKIPHQSEIYLDRATFGGEPSLVPRDSWRKGDLKLIWELNKLIPEPEEEEGWYDPAGGYHPPGEIDYASQYE